MSDPAPPGRRWSVASVALLAFVVVVQSLVLVAVFLLGLVWGGWTWFLALWLAVAGVLVAALLGVRRSPWVVAVPLVSALVSWGLYAADERYAEATGCNDAERAAVAELAPPPGTDVELEGNTVNGCSAGGPLEQPAGAFLQHYADELEAHGWAVQRRSATSVQAVNNGITIEVDVEDVEGGSWVLTVSGPTEG